MDVFGTVATVIDLGNKVKGTFEQAKQNGVDGIKLSVDILDSLVKIQHLSTQHSLENNPELRECLMDFESGLQTILARRQRLIRQGSGNWLNRSISKCKKIYYADDIKDELTELRQRIQICHQSLQTVCVIRTGAEVAEVSAHLVAIREEQTAASYTMQQNFNTMRNLVLKLSPGQRKSLALIEEQLEEHIRPSAEESMRDDDYTGVRSPRVPGTPQILNDGIRPLSNVPASSGFGTQYLKTEVKNLLDLIPNVLDQRVTSQLQPSPLTTGQSRSTIRWITHSPEASNHNSTRPDSARKIIRILKSFRDRNDVPYMDAALELDSLAIMLNDLGMWDEAMRISAWAVKIHCDLAESGDTSLSADFARSLHNHSAWLSRMGKYGDAIKSYGQSTSICRNLVKIDPSLFLPSLALSLSNLSNCLIKAGYHGEAMEPADESVKIYRRLSKDEPAEFLQDLAMALSNLSICKGNSGNFREAAKVLKECVGIYRDLVEGEPETFLPSLALSLSNLSGYLSTCGSYEEAHSLSDEAVNIYRLLARNGPAQFLSEFASSLRNLAYILGRMAKYEDGLQVTEEHIYVLGQLSKTKRTYLPLELAGALHRAAWYLQRLGRHQNALSKVDEALVLLSDHSQSSSLEKYHDSMVKYLDTRSSCLSGLGRHDEAISVGSQSLALLRDLHRNRPATYTPLLSDILLNHSRVLYLKGDFLQAERHARSSIGYLETLGHTAPKKYGFRIRKAAEHLSKVQATAAATEVGLTKSSGDDSLL